MTKSNDLLRTKMVQLLGCMTLCAATAVIASAQKPEARIVGRIDNSSRVSLPGTRSAIAQAESDAGRMDGTTQLENMSIVFSRSAAQQTALDALIAAQQDPSSPRYHQWLGPDEFAAQYGASDADIAKVEQWLQTQGFTVNGVSRSRIEVSFTGTVAQVEAAFGTELHYFQNGEQKNFAPAMDLSVPAALSTAVVGVAHLSDVKPRPHLRAVKLKPNFTSSQSGNHFVQPGDLAVIYDINAAYSAGYTGAGETIIVVGQSAIQTADITNFQSAAGLPIIAPTLTLMPGTGTSTLYTTDQSESDLDVEWSGGVAKGATVNFVYTGSGNFGTLDALQYAIQNKLGPIISNSYGICEVGEGQTNITTMNTYLQQAAAQGQTVISAAGDDGSNDCYRSSSLSAANQIGLSVDWPASSQYVTGLGGTEYTSAAIASSNSTYFAAANGSDVLVSAKSYIPEQVWNDSSASTGLSAGGGGVSSYISRPSWQTGVTGIPAGTFRLVPDISLASSPNNAGYLYCSSDSSTGITGSCAHGFRDANSTSLTIAGGTSFAAPIFAGILAIINQKTNNTYAGLVNPTLYTLASNATTYASAFHDITSGNNGCTNGVQYPTSFNTNGSVKTYGQTCTSAQAGQYTTNTGYDLATGLGSIDVYNLLQAWPNSAPKTGSSTTLSAATLTPQAGANDNITITVASASSGVTTVPTGTVLLTVDGAGATTLTVGANGTVTYSFSSTVTTAHVIQAVYSGDTVFSTSTGTITVTVVASTLKTSTTTATAATSPAIGGVTDAIAVTVAPSTGTTPVPTGSVAVYLDGASTAAATLTLSGTGTASYNYVPALTQAGLGSHTVKFSYAGDTNYQTSTVTLTLSVKSPGSFAMAASAVSVTAGSTTTETVNVTPAGGYFGLTNFTLSPSTILNACYTVTNPTISGTSVVPVAITIYTNGNNCSSQNLFQKASGKLAKNDAPASPRIPVPAGLALAGLAAVGMLGRRSRKLRGLVMLAMLTVAGFGLSGCGSTSTAGQGISTTAPKGAYTVTVTGTDSATGTITSTSTFTLTIQ